MFQNEAGENLNGKFVKIGSNPHQFQNDVSRPEERSRDAEILSIADRKSRQGISVSAQYRTLNKARDRRKRRNERRKSEKLRAMRIPIVEIVSLSGGCI
jgi:hypothetical protein